MTNEQAAYGQDFLQAVLNCRSERSEESRIISGSTMR